MGMALTISIEQACEEFGAQFLPCMQRHMSACSKQSRAILDETSGDLLLELDQLRANEHSIGWALGVLSAASAADALHARRERNGLPMMAQAFGTELCWAQSGLADLPNLRPDQSAGWEAAFLFGWLFSKTAPSPVMQWQFESERPALRVNLQLPEKTPSAELIIDQAVASISNAGRVGEPATGSLLIPTSWLQLEHLPSELHQA